MTSGPHKNVGTKNQIVEHLINLVNWTRFTCEREWITAKGDRTRSRAL